MFSTGRPQHWFHNGREERNDWHRPAERPTASEDAFGVLDLGDASIATVVQRLRRAAGSNLPVVLHGETGTGKELFARAIHDASPRRAGPFVAVNCASIPEGLIESELFGYRPGAFTGANSRGAKGLIQQAQGGTLFLDEIGDMPLALQSRLLRVLAEKEVTPVGSDTPVKADFRVVSATHRDLRARVAQGEFREDLMFRLHGLAVALPPLRVRTDIAVLAQRLLEAEQEAIGRPLTLSPCAATLIRRLSWPGNVRQLKQVLATAAWLSDMTTIRAVDIEVSLETGGADEPSPIPPIPVTDEPASTDERSLLLYSLRRNRWNVSLTAREFNTARTTIYRRMARFGIVQPHLLEH